MTWADPNLLANAQRGSQRLSEYCLLIDQTFGNGQQVACWNGNCVGKNAITIVNPQHRAVWAVFRSVTEAGRAMAATEVDRAYDATSNPGLIAGFPDLLDDADKLMPKYAFEGCVTLDDLQVG